MTATDEVDSDAVLAAENELTEGQRASRDSVLEVARQSVEMGIANALSLRMFLSPILAYDEEADEQVPNILRLQAGGEVPDIPADVVPDTPEYYMAKLARHRYPLTLAASDPPQFELPLLPHDVDVLTWLHHDPAKAEFERCVEADRELMALFTRETPESGKVGSFILSIGLGSGVQLVSLASTLLGAAYTSLQLRDELTHQRLVEEAVRSVTTLRTLIAGDTVTVPARYALTGIAVKEDAVIPLPWGVLRAPTRGEHTRTATTPSLRFGDSFRQETEAVLEMEFPLRMTIEADPEINDPERFRESRELQANAEEQVRLTSLLLLLALERESLVASSHAWTIIDNPVGHPARSWALGLRPLQRYDIDGADGTVLSNWGERLQQSYHDSIQVAMHRVLSALASRFDPADGFIDAMIALENLFAGTDTGELRFRISAAIAWLLKPDDPAARARLQNEVKVLYDRRSKLVHGSVPPLPERDEPDRIRAVELCTAALRRLFTDHPSLVRDRNRGTKLILRSPQD